MPYQRNSKHGSRKSRSRSPYHRHQSFRRSRSPRTIHKRSGNFSNTSRDLGRRRPPTHRERRVASPVRRSPVSSKSRDSKPSLTSPSREKDGKYSRHTESRLQSRSSSSRSPVRQQEVGRSPHMDIVNSEKEIQRRIVRKKMTLTERFSVHEKKFHLEENITIGLQRNPHIPISTVVNVENQNFDFNKFVLKRRVDEGSKPIFDREEIKAFGHDDNLDDQEEFERRVITVLPPKDEGRNSRGMGSEAVDVDMSVRRSLSTSMSYDDRHWIKDSRNSDHSPVTSSRRERDERSSYKGEKLQITRWRTPSPRREPQVRLDPRPDPRYEAKFRANSNREREGGYGHKKMVRIESITQNPNDLRHSLLHRRISNPAEDARFRIEAKRHDHDSRDSKSSHGRDFKPGQGRDAWTVANEYHRDKGRSRTGDRQDNFGDLRNSLPDFSKREGRFDYEEWKDKPEMVPKGQSYYEHDNRDEDSGYFPRRGRGRPFTSSFRSRPDTRRFPSSRGGYRPKPYSQQYSHDRPSSSRSAPTRDRDRNRDSDSFRSRGRSSRYGSSLGSRRRGSVEQGEWKHDMYDKLEKEDDNCPTSTT